MNLLKRSFNKCLYSGEEGFVLPLALGIGLIMLLFGMTMIARSQNDQITAISQKQTAQSLTAAESGAARVQTFINSNRSIATYNLEQWKSGEADTNSISCDTSTPDAKTYGIEASQDWQPLTSDTSDLGPHYKLIDYIYEPENSANGPNSTPGVGTLTVAGRTGSSQSQVEVKIPIQVASTVPYNFPGMWVSTSVTTGDTKAHVLGPCTGTMVVNNLGYSTQRTKLKIPSPPPKPTTGIVTIANPTGLILPRPQDLADQSNFKPATGEYQYAVSQITGSFTITPGYKVAIYLDGNINMTGGQKAILHQCGAVPNCRPTDARIYGLSPTGTIALGGNAAICDIFFLAPTYTVEMKGGGQAQGCGGGANQNGIYWVKSWKGGGQGNHVSLDQTSDNWDGVLPFLPIELPPQLAPVTFWQRQSVQEDN